MNFAHACCASLLVHAAMLGAPAGSLSPAGGDTGPTSRAPLAVTLKTKSTTGDERPAVPLSAVRKPGLLPQSTGFPAPRYYDAAEVTRRAKAIGDIAPLPPALASSGEMGRLILVLRIGSDGRVVDVDVGDSTIGDVLADALAERFRALRFHPAELDGIAVASRMKIEILLRPPGA